MSQEEEKLEDAGQGEEKQEDAGLGVEKQEDAGHGQENPVIEGEGADYGQIPPQDTGSEDFSKTAPLEPEAAVEKIRKVVNLVS